MKASTVWIWGRRPVLEALRSNAARSILIATERKPSPVLSEIRRLAAERNVALRTVPPTEIERIAPGQNTQGVAAQATELRIANVNELLSLVEQRNEPPFLLVLDQVQDPQNLGALLRTADAAGAQAVLVPERRSAHISGAVAKASAGAVSHIPVLEATNLVRALDSLREAGIWIAGLDGSASQSLFNVDFTVPIAVLVGSEASGLRRLTREHCDFLVRLPMLGSIESLNAAVAGSIAMYEVVRQRASLG